MMDLLPHKVYEKMYKEYIIEKLPVIRSIEVSDGNLTDLFVHIKYADFYEHSPDSFVRAVGWFMKDVHVYLGNPTPSVTIRMDRGDEFMSGTFVENEI